jgi:hypothetical protein
MKSQNLLFSILLGMVFISCKKEKTGAEGLPPETQTGANTFGCLIKDELLTPGGRRSLECYYRYMGNGPWGGYHFILSAKRKRGDGEFGVSMVVDSIKLQEGVKYKLSLQGRGRADDQYYFYTRFAPLSYYYTDSTRFTGELWIKKLDTVQRIVAGTFWFDAENYNGQKVEVR